MQKTNEIETLRSPNEREILMGGKSDAEKEDRLIQRIIFYKRNTLPGLLPGTNLSIQLEETFSRNFHSISGLKVRAHI